MSLTRTAVLAWVAGATAAAPLAAQLNADSAAMVDRVFAAVARTDTPGCTLGIDRDGQPLYRRAYGMASLESSAPMTRYSVVESGSVAKQFTAAAILKLAGEGKLNLDDPIRKYIPELAEYPTPVTIRMAIHHTSGVRDMWTLFNLAGQASGTVLYTMDQALKLVYRQKDLNFPANSEFLYSNSGYLLLAEVVGRVSGMPLSRYSQEHFFRPLGMTSTQWRDDWNRVVPGRVTAYSTTQGGGYRVEMPYMSVYGAGGLFTTVDDLLKWNQNLDDARVGGRAWADAMLNRQRLTSGREIDYASGLFATRYRNEREISHGGATGGYRTFLSRWPDRKLSMAVLCNVSNANPDALAHRVADVFIGAPAAVAAADRPAAQSSGPSAVDLTGYVGRYRSPETEQAFTLSIRDARLFADGPGRSALSPTGTDRFRADAAPIEFVFRRSAGKVSGFGLVAGGGDTTNYEASNVPATTPAQLIPMAGTYYSPELDVSYTLTAKDTSLVVSVGVMPDRTLSRTGPDSFAAGGMGLRFTRGKNGRPDGFLLFAGRVTNLRFERR